MHDIASSVEALDARDQRVLGRCSCSPGRTRRKPSKALVRAVAHRPIDERVVADTAERIAPVRASDEGREGIAAFLTRRVAGWVPESLRSEEES